MQNLWQTLAKPLMILAPMEGVTDTVFRRVVTRAAKPDIFFTEFTSVDGLMSRGFDFVGQRLKFTPEERPLVAQIWGLDPENYRKTAELLVEMGFDGVDINMGCPVKDVIKKGACSALITNKPLAGEIIQATKEGLKGRIPLSVKIRIGFKEIETEAWTEFLLRQGIDALTVHGRMTKEMSKVPCRWEEIGKAVEVRNHMFNSSGIQFHSPFTPILRQGLRLSSAECPQDGTPSSNSPVDSAQLITKPAPLIIGNGDVKSREDAYEKVERYGVDGVMIGRGIFENPWVFGPATPKTTEDRLELLIYHMQLFEEHWATKKHRPPFNVLKRFFKIYVNGFEGAHDMRIRLMETATIQEAMQFLRTFYVSPTQP